jgi:hypothetical protein
LANPSNTTVCFTVVLRDDFRPDNAAFDADRADPSAEILVCPWWGIEQPKTKRVKVVRLLGDVFFGMYVSASAWPVYTFVSVFPVEQSVTDFDLYQFVSAVLSYHSALSSHYIASIQMGLRVYSGMGSFSIQQADVKVNILEKDAIVIA